jgi:hypothetical protein
LVVLDGARDGEVPPGLAIAWAERHLEGLLALEPPLSEAAHAVLDDFAPPAPAPPSRGEFAEMTA